MALGARVKTGAAPNHKRPPRCLESSDSGVSVLCVRLARGASLSANSVSAGPEVGEYYVSLLATPETDGQTDEGSTEKDSDLIDPEVRCSSCNVARAAETSAIAAVHQIRDGGARKIGERLDDDCDHSLRLHAEHERPARGGDGAVAGGRAPRGRSS